jgi:hypothetical protein
MRIFEGRPGKVLYADALAEELDTFRDTIQNGVNNLKRRPEWGELIEVVIRGQAWKYNGPAGEVKAGTGNGEAKLCFEELGRTREGDLIIQSDDGRLFRATEL